MDVNMVIFDLDGTLIDTIGDLSAAVEHALCLGGFPGHTVDEYRNMVGHGIRNLVTRALPEGSSEEVIDIALGRFVEYYTAHIDVLSRPYPGIHELLRELSSEGVRLAVASNKFQAGTEALIRRFFSDIPFVKILGNAPGLPLKPDPEVIRLAIAAGVDSVGLEAARPDPASLRFAPYPGKWSSESTLPPQTAAVMVGDSGTDIRTARNAGIPAIAVSWGFRPRADLEIADAIADTPGQLKDFIRIFTQKN
ncbi:MAG: HAD hydrolase-like protein [Bacteroidales bacterium]|nr:HAD hydrolase-like protein [Bacteroidales bacterium]MBP3270173.1 HAD hydrolase-like protein [Bacteroidales bacterium]